ncbi:oligosaccharide flippase family protein [Shivajiella indica]|uniref:Oligosaccharide flippase family protein n=1 Tax=Shivajiella indica TaxID=872115 RepID=A0ABW5BDL4_9BACT
MSLISKLQNNKVFKNFSYLTIGNAVSQVLSLVTVLKITHFFTPDDYGLFTFITTQGLLLLALSELGIKQIIIRAIARDPERTSDLIINGSILRFLSVTGLTLIYLLYNHFFGTLDAFQVILVGACAMSHAFWNMLEYAFLGHQKMLFPSLLKIAYSILWFTSIFILPQAYFSVNNLIYIFILLNGVQGVGFVFLIKKNNLLIGPTSNFFKSTKAILIESWPYFSVMLVMIPIQSFHNIYLELNSTVDEIGFFNLARRLLAPVQMVLDYALIAAFPSLSALWISDKKKFYSIISNGFQYFMLVGLALTFLFTLFVEEIVILLFSEAYLPSVTVTQMQVWFTFLMAVNRTISIVFGAINEEKLLFKLSIINAVISIPMLYYGSQFGAYGLSVGYVLSFAILEIYLWIIFTKTIHVKIKNDLIMWFLAILLFIVSFFFSELKSIPFKLFLAILVLTPISIFLYRQKKVKNE